MLYHTKTHVDNVFSLLQNVTLVTVSKTQNDVTVADCVDFVDVVLETFFVELLEEFTEHLYDNIGLILVFF